MGRGEDTLGRTPLQFSANYISTKKTTLKTNEQSYHGPSIERVFFIELLKNNIRFCPFSKEKIKLKCINYQRVWEVINSYWKVISFL